MLDGPITSVKFFTSASNPAAVQSRKAAGRCGAVGPSHMMHTHTYTYVHTSTYMCTCTHTYIHVHSHTLTHTYMCIHTHLHTHPHIDAVHLLVTSAVEPAIVFM